MGKLSRIKILLISFILYLFTFLNAQQSAFPLAEGFGKYTSRGRGGIVISVSNLNDSGPGSLRAAVETEQPWIILFRISGKISLQSAPRIEADDITIAGQSEAGDDLCNKGYPTAIDANNLIICLLRFHLGNVNKIADGAITAIGKKYNY